MKYKGKIIAIQGDKAVVRYKPRTSGCGGWGGGAASRSEIMRDVTALNRVAAKEGDEVNFEFPDMIDAFAMLKHSIIPLIIAIVIALLASVLLRSALPSLGGLLVNVIAVVIAVVIYKLSSAFLLSKGVIAKSDKGYTIEITEIIGSETANKDFNMN